jgi:CubicO group peptidase (beta-lactamase class C family)
VEYSDVGFVVLFAAAERAAGEPLFRLLDRRVYGPLKMRSTTYLAGRGLPHLRAHHARRERRAGARAGARPHRARLGGMAGNAGLFSTAHDLGRFAAMMANGGELDGVRVFSEETVRAVHPRQPDVGTRALGWDTPGPGHGGAGRSSRRPSFGHTGFTGTSIWIDPSAAPGRCCWPTAPTSRTGPTRSWPCAAA